MNGEQGQMESKPNSHGVFEEAETPLKLMTGRLSVHIRTAEYRGAWYAGIDIHSRTFGIGHPSSLCGRAHESRDAAIACSAEYVIKHELDPMLTSTSSVVKDTERDECRKMIDMIREYVAGMYQTSLF